MGNLRGTASVTFAALLAGCSVAKPPPAPTPVDEPGKPMFSRITQRCGALPANLPVVKIRLTDVAPKKLGHDTALFEANKDGSGSTEKRLKDIPEVVLQTENPTRLDIDAQEFLKKAGDILLVEVELADPSASFVGGGYALTAGNADGAAMFCVKDPIDPKPGDRTVRFYVQYQESRTPRFGKYNLFLLLQDGPYRVPVVLDPKVHNSGFA